MDYQWTGNGARHARSVSACFDCLRSRGLFVVYNFEQRDRIHQPIHSLLSCFAPPYPPSPLPHPLIAGLTTQAMSRLEPSSELPYAKMAENVAIVRKRVGPLTLAEKITYGHLDSAKDQVATHEIVHGRNRWPWPILSSFLEDPFLTRRRCGLGTREGQVLPAPSARPCGSCGPFT